jgi:Na+/H+-dicarboxylate symporter
MGENDDEIICSESCIELVKILRDQYYEYQRQKENMAWVGMALYVGAMFAFITEILPKYRCEGLISLMTFLILAVWAALYFVKKQ